MFCHVPLPGHPLCHIPPKSIYYAIVRLPHGQLELYHAFVDISTLDSDSLRTIEKYERKSKIFKMRKSKLMTETKNMEVDFHKVPDEKKSLEPRNILNDRSCEVDTNNLFEITLFQNTPSYSI